MGATLSRADDGTVGTTTLAIHRWHGLASNDIAVGIVSEISGPLLAAFVRLHVLVKYLVDRTLILLLEPVVLARSSSLARHWPIDLDISGGYLVHMLRLGRGGPTYRGQATRGSRLVRLDLDRSGALAN